MVQLKDYLQEEYESLVQCMNRELREAVPERLLQVQLPAELYSYFDTKKREEIRKAIEEKMYQADMRIYFRKKVINLVNSDPLILPFEE